MKNSLYAFALIVSIIIPLGVTETASGSIVIDNFSAGNTLSQFGTGTNNQVTIDSSIFGGSRIDSLTVRDLGGDEFFGAIGFGGDFSIGQGSDDQIFGSLNYVGFKDADLTEGGFNDQFAFTFVANDLDAPLANVFQILVTSNGVSQIVNIDVPPGSQLPDTVNVGFDQFSGIDFTQIDSIQLLFDFQSQPGRDFVLSSFSAIGGGNSGGAVPEHSSAIVLAIACGTLAMRRRG